MIRLIVYCKDRLEIIFRLSDDGEYISISETKIYMRFTFEDMIYKIFCLSERNAFKNIFIILLSCVRKNVIINHQVRRGHSSSVLRNVTNEERLKVFLYYYYIYRKQPNSDRLGQNIQFVTLP